MFTELKKIVDEDESIYRSFEGLGGSGLHGLLVSPHTFKNGDGSIPPTAAFRLGTLIHEAVLTPKIFAENYHTIKNFSSFTENDETCRGTYIEPSEWDYIQKIYDNVHGCKEAHTLLENIYPEVSIYGKYLGVQLKGRVDGYPKKKMPFIIDLKTSSNAAGFAESGYKYGYFMQMAHYCSIANAVEGHDMYRNMVFIVVDKNTYEVFGWRVDPKRIDECFHDWDICMRIYKKCLSSNIWPTTDQITYTTKLKTISTSKNMFNRIF